MNPTIRLRGAAPADPPRHPHTPPVAQTRTYARLEREIHRHWGPSMGEIINFPIALDSDLGRELIIDLARFNEQLVSEKALRKKYRFSEHDWQNLGGNDELISAIENETTRRVRDGSAKREKAQQLVVKAPGVLGDIMNDPSANPRHRIDSAKALDDFAANGPEAAAAGARFVIQINLGADHIETYSKSIAVDAEDEDPYHPTPPEILAAIAAKKNEGDGGNHI